MRQCLFPNLEAALVLWMKEARAINKPLSGEIVKAKSRQLAEKMGVTTFEASDGWLDRFKQRHDLTFCVISGEANIVHAGLTAAAC